MIFAELVHSSNNGKKKSHSIIYCNVLNKSKENFSRFKHKLNYIESF